jgi:transcriptional regulator with XRE-family HTH domain
MTARKPLLPELEAKSHQWCRQIAGTIIRVRGERGWSQRELGEQIGLTQSQVSALESHPDALHIKRLYGTLHALGLELVVQPLAAGRNSRRRSEANTHREEPEHEHNDQSGDV